MSAPLAIGSENGCPGVNVIHGLAVEALSSALGLELA
jgi:hypothetical protein